jgi:hypothetical protein
MLYGMSTSGFVYLWYDKRCNRFYVGSHWGSAEDGYICSSRWMKRAYDRRPGDFKRRILVVVKTNRVDLFNEEQRWLDMIKPAELRVRYYNIRACLYPKWLLDEDSKLTVAQKISKTLKGRKTGPASKEHCAAVSAGKKAEYEKRRNETGSATHPHMLDMLRTVNIGRKLSGAHVVALVEGRRLAGKKRGSFHPFFNFNCAYCGRKAKGRGRQIYCSKKCASDALTLRHNPNIKRLGTPENTAMRSEISRRVRSDPAFRAAVAERTRKSWLKRRRKKPKKKR